MLVGAVDMERNGMFLDIFFELHEGLDLWMRKKEASEMTPEFLA